MNWLKRHEWWIVGSLALCACVLGYSGIAIHYATFGIKASPPDLVYGVLQLFRVANPVSAEGAASLSAPNALIQIARFLAPATVAYSLIRLVATAITDAASKISVASLEGHAVVCGANDEGMTIARSLLSEGHIVVVVEPDAQNPCLGELKADGAKIVLGSPLDTAVLKRARVHAALKVAVITDNERTNFGVASKCTELAEKYNHKRASRPIVKVRAHASADFADVFQEVKPFAPGGNAADTRFFDTVITSARQIALDVSVNFSAQIVANNSYPRLLIVGDGRFSAALTGMILRLMQLPDCLVPTIDVVSPNLDEVLENFPQTHPQLSLVGSLNFYEKPRGALLSDEFHLVDSTSGKAYNLALVALDDPFASIKLAQRLNQQIRAAEGINGEDINMDLVVCIKPNAALAGVENYLPGERYGHLLNVTKIGCASSAVFDDILDAEARKAHESYLAHLDRKDFDSSIPAIAPWAELKEEYKAANRRTIDHDHIKRIFLAKDSSSQMFDALAEAEHRSWLADRIIAGWRFGPNRDDSKKLHPSIVPYADLSESEKAKDIEKVNRVADTLKSPYWG